MQGIKKDFNVGSITRNCPQKHIEVVLVILV